MRTQRATRYSRPTDHAQYGIYNWFVRKGIMDKEVMEECMYAFCDECKFDMEQFKKTIPRFAFIQARFIHFANFTMNYISDNNYLN